MVIDIDRLAPHVAAQLLQEAIAIDRCPTLHDADDLSVVSPQAFEPLLQESLASVSPQLSLVFLQHDPLLLEIVMKLFVLASELTDLFYQLAMGLKNRFLSQGLATTSITNLDWGTPASFARFSHRALSSTDGK
jgi:hypothetical protein